MPKYISYKDVAEMCGVHEATIWRWRKSEGFPNPIKVASNTTRFDADEVEAWFEERVKA